MRVNHSKKRTNPLYLLFATLSVALLAGCGTAQKPRDFGDLKPEDNSHHEKAPQDYSAEARTHALRQTRDTGPEFAGFFDKQPDSQLKKIEEEKKAAQAQKAEEKRLAKEAEKAAKAQKAEEKRLAKEAEIAAKAQKAEEERQAKKVVVLPIVEQLDSGKRQYTGNMASSLPPSSKPTVDNINPKADEKKNEPVVESKRPLLVDHPQKNADEDIITRADVGEEKPFGYTILDQDPPLSPEAWRRRNEEFDAKDKIRREKRREEKKELAELNYTDKELNPPCDGEWHTLVYKVDGKTKKKKVQLLGNGPRDGEVEKAIIVGAVSCVKKHFFSQDNMYVFFEPGLPTYKAKVILGPDKNFLKNYKLIRKYRDTLQSKERQEFDALLTQKLQESAVKHIANDFEKGSKDISVRKTRKQIKEEKKVASLEKKRAKREARQERKKVAAQTTTPFVATPPADSKPATLPKPEGKAIPLPAAAGVLPTSADDNKKPVSAVKTGTAIPLPSAPSKPDITAAETAGTHASEVKGPTENEKVRVAPTAKGLFKTSALDLTARTVMPYRVMNYSPGHYGVIKAQRAKRHLKRVMVANQATCAPAA